jgi:hypothetical protein
MEPEFTLIGGILRFERMVDVVRTSWPPTSMCRPATWCSSRRASGAAPPEPARRGPRRRRGWTAARAARRAAPLQRHLHPRSAPADTAAGDADGVGAPPPAHPRRRFPQSPADRPRPVWRARCGISPHIGRTTTRARGAWRPPCERRRQPLEDHGRPPRPDPGIRGQPRPAQADRTPAPGVEATGVSRRPVRSRICSATAPSTWSCSTWCPTARRWRRSDACRRMPAACPLSSSRASPTCVSPVEGCGRRRPALPRQGRDRRRSS